MYLQFGKAFFSCDCLIMAPIYPARELPIPGVNAKMITDAATQSGHHNVHLIEENAQIIPSTLALLQEGDILITMGAGNIWQYGEEILAQLKINVDTKPNVKNLSNLKA